MTVRSGAMAVPWAGLGLLVAVALVLRLVVAAGSTEGNMDPDAAHFLNIARAFGRGEGFVNPAAWPAWMAPAQLPMPETFKEPGYPWVIARLTGLIGEGFRAGQFVSIVCGALLPAVVYLLGRRRGLAADAATLGALLATASPLLLAQSARVMVDATFALLVAGLFLAASANVDDVEARRGTLRDIVAGTLFGLAFLFRAQTLLLLLPFVALLAERRPPRRALLGLALAAGAAVVVASPLWWRNLQLFGTPLYSDVVAFGIWPYVDHLTFSHGLDRPPSPIGFALAHLPEVLRHMVTSLVRFVALTLPREILGNPLWMLPLVTGLLLSLRRSRAWAFAYLYLGGTLAFISAVHWDARYFTSTAALWCLFAGAGVAWLARPLLARPLIGPLHARSLLVAAAAVTMLAQLVVARRDVARFAPPELAAARGEAPFLRTHLEPGESVMAVTTSYWSWFADRPSVHLVIADSARLDDTLERLRVRYVALPTSRLAELAEAYPGRRLPAAFRLLREDRARDVTLFAVAREPQ